MRLKEEIDVNIRTLAGDVQYTPDDRALLAEFCAKAYESDAIKGMRIELEDSRYAGLLTRHTG